jgi:hypothetical protein
MSDVKQLLILTGRKGYEFKLDSLRLSMLSTTEIRNLIGETFRFQAHAVGTPPATFGPVPVTLPPGVIFQVGEWISEDGGVVPIRFINMEPSRIVIDVAGPTAAAEAIFAALNKLLADKTAPDGLALIGNPDRVLTFSECSFIADGDLLRLFVPPVHTLWSKVATREGIAEERAILFPTVHMRVGTQVEINTGDVNYGDGRSFTLALRAGTTPNEQTFFSSAPLDTEPHVAYLQELTRLLT